MLVRAYSWVGTTRIAMFISRHLNWKLDPFLLASFSEGMTPGFKALGEKPTAGWRADAEDPVDNGESS